MRKRRNSPTFDASFTQGVVRSAAFASALCAFACGAGDQADVTEVMNGDDAGAEVASGINVCPHFEGSLVMPQRIRPNEPSVIAVGATDPDASDSQLVFAWTGTAGTFDPSDKSVTIYRCTRLGSELLTVTATDRKGCVSSLKIAVECIAN
ncbi:MAG TPA: hypothetical protein VGC79_26510 [Polyangiaceae bacterium]